MELPIATIYTDGACAPYPERRGGWAYVICRGDAREEMSGSVNSTTSNRMELQAAIEALRSLQRPSKVEVRSDAQYLVNGMSSWLAGWKKRNWQKADNRQVLNRDQWEELDALSQRHVVKWIWTPGHSGDPGNERCDVLANRQAGIADGGVHFWPSKRAAATSQKSIVDIIAAETDEDQSRSAPTEDGPHSGSKATGNISNGEAVRGRWRDNKRTKIVREGQACRKCGLPVVRCEHGTPQKYKAGRGWYEWWLRCPGCKTDYFDEAAKRFFDEPQEAEPVPVAVMTSTVG